MDDKEMKEKFIDAMADIHHKIGFSVVEMEVPLFNYKTEEGDKVKYILKGEIIKKS